MNRVPVAKAFFAVAALLIFCTTGWASIKVGDTIRFQNGPGSPGGEFGIAHSATPNITELVTFCVERTEFVNFTSNFYVESIETYATNGGSGAVGGQDPVDARTAWLYYNFRHETLANYTYGALTDTSSSRVNSADALQKAIWFLESELASPGSGAAFVAAANAEMNSFLNNSLGYTGNMAAAIQSVRILNLLKNNASGESAQSQLFLVPEPGSLLVWGGLGLVGLVVGRRRK